MKIKTIMLLIMMIASIIPVNAASEDVLMISLNMINQDPDPATAGDMVEIRIGIENLGGKDASDLMLEFDLDYPLTMPPGENNIKTAGALQGFQNLQNMKIVKYKLQIDREAKAGQYGFTVKAYEKETPLVAQALKSFTIDIKSRETAEVIHIDKTNLLPGKQTSLKFSINNEGNAPLRDMTFYWENEDKIILPVGSDNTRYIKYVDIGESAEIEYQVIADSNAAAGLYQLNLYLTYDDTVDSTPKTIETIAGVYVGGETDFDVAFSESSSGQTSFSIANIGSNPANSVSVVIPEQKAWRVTGTNSAIIGNLNKGDYTVASFKLAQAMSGMNRTRADATAGTPQIPQQRTTEPLLMQIAYTDTTGERKLIEKQLTISPQNLATNITMNGFSGRGAIQQKGFFTTYKWYIIGAVLLILCYVGYRKYQNKKLLNPNFKIKDLIKKKK
ncbi:MAG: COG1361 S-layer family protein [Candidatus Woesearchaeota archaeon]|nr:COG1361 S-layer family protein [Candidatus Woesearchaeota archaeon]